MPGTQRLRGILLASRDDPRGIAPARREFLRCDGGFRRGTDVLKALALGADAVCVGRPYCWGLGAFGESGVARCLELPQAELVRAMQLAGAPTLGRIGRDLVTGPA